MKVNKFPIVILKACRPKQWTKNLLIVEKVTFNENGIWSPFPAKGMRKVEEFIKKEFVRKYKFETSIQTYKKNHYIFIRNDSNELNF